MNNIQNCMKNFWNNEVKTHPKTYALGVGVGLVTFVAVAALVLGSRILGGNENIFVLLSDRAIFLSQAACLSVTAGVMTIFVARKIQEASKEKPETQTTLDPSTSYNDREGEVMDLPWIEEISTE